MVMTSVPGVTIKATSLPILFGNSDAWLNAFGQRGYLGDPLDWPQIQMTKSVSTQVSPTSPGSQQTVLLRDYAEQVLLTDQLPKNDMRPVLFGVVRRGRERHGDNQEAA